MSYQAINLRKTETMDQSAEVVEIVDVSISGTTLTIDYTVDTFNLDTLTSNATVTVTGDGVDESTDIGVTTEEGSVDISLDWLEDGEEFVIGVSVFENNDLIQMDEWTVEVSESGEGDVTLQINCSEEDGFGLDPDEEEVAFEVEYVDGGPLISGIIVEAEVDGQYAGETTVAGQSIGPGETASGSISIDPPTEPGDYPVRVGIVSGSWQTF